MNIVRYAAGYVSYALKLMSKPSVFFVEFLAVWPSTVKKVGNATEWVLGENLVIVIWKLLVPDLDSVDHSTYSTKIHTQTHKQRTVTIQHTLE